MSTQVHGGSDSLFSGNKPVTESERIRRLASFFSPSPLDATGKSLTEGGPVLMIPAAAYRDLPKNFYVGELKGSIEVSPPKDRCLTITKDNATRDVRVCKKTEVSFRLDELSVSGILTWKVATGSDDTGTYLSWQTPHRTALALGINQKGPDGKLLADSTPEFINSCETFNDENGRRIHLKLFDGRIWVVRFPDRDIMLPQPPPPPNLFVLVKSQVNIGTGNQPPPKSQPQPKAEPSPAASAPPPVAPVPAEPAAALPWTVTSKLTYSMNAAFFMPDGISTPGIPGRCRYRYSDPEYHPVGGVIECQNAPGYIYVVAPMACSSAFSPLPPATP